MLVFQFLLFPGPSGCLLQSLLLKPFQGCSVLAAARQGHRSCYLRREDNLRVRQSVFYLLLDGTTCSTKKQVCFPTFLLKGHWKEETFFKACESRKSGCGKAGWSWFYRKQAVSGVSEFYVCVCVCRRSRVRWSHDLWSNLSRKHRNFNPVTFFFSPVFSLFSFFLQIFPVFLFSDAHTDPAGRVKHFTFVQTIWQHCRNEIQSLIKTSPAVGLMFVGPTKPTCLDAFYIFGLQGCTKTTAYCCWRRCTHTYKHRNTHTHSWLAPQHGGSGEAGRPLLLGTRHPLCQECQLREWRDERKRRGELGKCDAQNKEQEVQKRWRMSGARKERKKER